MRRLILRLLSFLLPIVGCLLLGGGRPTFGAARRVELRASPPLMQDVDALPRLVAGARPQARRSINAVLARVDARALQTARECLQEKGGDFSRSVAVTMQGPRFLSFVDRNSYFCAGAAHPDNDMLALVFDLTDGKTVNWEKLLPGKVRKANFGAEAEKQFPYDVVVSSDAIWALYKAAALKDHANDPECVEAFSEKLDFRLSLNARENAVDADETGLRHAVQACGQTLSLSPETLKSLGAAGELVEALDAAHRAPPSAAH